MKLKFLMMAGSLMYVMSSCTIGQQYQVTGAAIGSKEGQAKSKIFGKSDFSIKAAADNGGITTIGAVQHTQKLILGFPIFKTTVYGN
jgi:hypothetical protein